MKNFSDNVPLLIDLVNESIEDDFYDTIAMELELDSAVHLMVANLATTLDGDLSGPIDQDKISMFVMVANLLVENFLLNYRAGKMNIGVLSRL